MWTLQCSRKNLKSWILQAVNTQVQLSQTGVLGSQNWGHAFTSCLWEVRNTKPETTNAVCNEKKSLYTFMHWIYTRKIHIYVVNTIIKSNLVYLLPQMTTFGICSVKPQLHFIYLNGNQFGAERFGQRYFIWGNVWTYISQKLMT